MHDVPWRRVDGTMLPRSRPSGRRLQDGHAICSDGFGGFRDSRARARARAPIARLRLRGRRVVDALVLCSCTAGATRFLSFSDAAGTLSFEYNI